MMLVFEPIFLTSPPTLNSNLLFFLFFSSQFQSTMLAKLETLPWLALSRICEYLDDDDDDYDTRSDLRAFSLTSRQCCAATASRRYCEVRLAVTSADDLVRGLEQWTEMLDGGRYRYVQRLKVILPDHDKAKKG